MSKPFQLRDFWSLIVSTYKEWNASDPFRLSAIVSYYAVFSLPALLIIIIYVTGIAFGQAEVQAKIVREIQAMIGPDAADTVETMINSTNAYSQSIWTIVIGIGTLIFGATGLFVQLQKSLNAVWDVEGNPSAGYWKLIKDRIFSLGLVLVIGFLLLVSLELTAAISALSDWIQLNLPEFTALLIRAINFIISFGMVVILFAMIFKFLPDVEIGWRSVWLGAIVTAILFSIGKEGLGIYFGHSDPGSAYGAAGAIILILLWVNYSCLILFFGAEFTQVYAEKYGHSFRPSPHAEWDHRKKWADYQARLEEE